MCGYIYDTGTKITNEFIVKEFLRALEFFKKNEIEYLKIYTSGSFLDEEEIDTDTREFMLKKLNELNLRRLCIETRVEFIKPLKLEYDYELEYAIGLESSNDFVRNVLINKDLNLQDFEEAIKLCKKNKIKTKIYLLLKPPFLTERDAIEDCIKSAMYCSQLGVDKISINPMNIQKFTLVEYLWKNNEYSLPWLWSLVHVLKEIKLKVRVPVVSYPVAAGTSRGIHNCKRCSKKVLSSILNFSLTQNVNYLEEIDCHCKNLWRELLFLEDLNRSNYNISREFYSLPIQNNESK